MKDPNRFYKYIYLDPRYPGKYTYNNFISFYYKPRYVGKGHGKRWLSHCKVGTHNKTLQNLIKTLCDLGLKQEDFVIKVLENITNEESFIFEKFLIECIGRKDIQTGPLFNHTSGGDGGDTILNRICIHNKKLNEQKYVVESELPTYILNDWKIGVLNRTKEHNQKISEAHKKLDHNSMMKEIRSRIKWSNTPNAGSWKKGRKAHNAGDKGVRVWVHNENQAITIKKRTIRRIFE